MGVEDQRAPLCADGVFPTRSPSHDLPEATLTHRLLLTLWSGDVLAPSSPACPVQCSVRGFVSPGPRDWGGCTLQGCSRAGGSWRWWGRREDAVLVRKVQPQSATSEGGTFAPCAPPRSLSPPGMGVPGRGSAVLFWRCPLYLGVISGARVSEPSGEQLPAVLWVSLLELGLDHMASRGAFQPQPFCSSGIL